MTNAVWAARVQELLRTYDPFKNLQYFETLVTEPDVIQTWDDVVRWADQFPNGCFRGHRVHGWHLETTLDRELWQTIEIRTEDIHSTGVHPINPEENERMVLEAYRRSAHQHHAYVPQDDELIDWLALIQHYGAPTRMLDWTRSPYVALYFALRNDDYHEDSALWAIDQTWLEQCARE